MNASAKRISAAPWKYTRARINWLPYLTFALPPLTDKPIPIPREMAVKIIAIIMDMNRKVVM